MGKGKSSRSWTHDAIVIGAGAAGLTAAGGCARLGLRVALVERDRMGGECLNTGCVPSKALIAAARRAHGMRGNAMGVSATGLDINFAGVRAHVQAAIAAIAPHDSAERFAAWGVEVIHGHACFVGPRMIEVAGRKLSAPRIVVAAGSRPAVPPVPGLAQAPYLTNETLFELQALPRHLLVMGAGAVGLEMAQAFRRLGAEVTVFDHGRPLPRHDPDAAAVVLDQLRSEGIVIHSGASAVAVSAAGGGVEVRLAGGRVLEGSHLLVATGRQPALDGLGLEAAGIEASSDGIAVDSRRRTSNRHILAIGDCRAGPRFTHAAGYEGGIAVMAVGFGIPAQVDYATLPSVVFTDPELAQLGLTETEARKRHRRVQVVQEAFADNDRAVADGSAVGFARIVLAGRRVAGATAVGAGVADLLLPWSLAMRGRAGTWAIGGAVVAYPTRSDINKALGFAAWDGLVFSRAARAWAGALAALRRLG